MREIPPAVRTRVALLFRRASDIDAWWTKPVMTYDGRRPCEMPDWEIEELISKIEDSPMRQNARSA